MCQNGSARHFEESNETVSKCCGRALFHRKDTKSTSGKSLFDKLQSSATQMNNIKQNGTTALEVDESTHLLDELIQALRRIDTGPSSTGGSGGSDTQIRHNRLVLEWREVSIILDRFFVVLYFVIICGSLLLLFPRPHSL